jgi:hypothetical protein
MCQAKEDETVTEREATFVNLKQFYKLLRVFQREDILGFVKEIVVSPNQILVTSEVKNSTNVNDKQKYQTQRKFKFSLERVREKE